MSLVVNSVNGASGGVSNVHQNEPGAAEKKKVHFNGRNEITPISKLRLELTGEEKADLWQTWDEREKATAEFRVEVLPVAAIIKEAVQAGGNFQGAIEMAIKGSNVAISESTQRELMAIDPSKLKAKNNREFDAKVGKTATKIREAHPVIPETPRVTLSGRIGEFLQKSWNWLCAIVNYILWGD